jgi:CHAT domain-containing protein
VQDRATSDLMTRFYGGIQQGLPAADSLREAMRFMCDQSPHPSLWAPFILVGG